MAFQPLPFNKNRIQILRLSAEKILSTKFFVPLASKVVEDSINITINSQHLNKQSRPIQSSQFNGGNLNDGHLEPPSNPHVPANPGSQCNCILARQYNRDPSILSSGVDKNKSPLQAATTDFTFPHMRVYLLAAEDTEDYIFSHWLILDIPLEIIKRSLVCTEYWDFLPKGHSTWHRHRRDTMSPPVQNSALESRLAL